MPPLSSVKRYGDHNGVLHRFLIFHVVRTDGKDFYLRMDRRRDPAMSHFWRLGCRDYKLALPRTLYVTDFQALVTRLNVLSDR